MPSKIDWCDETINPLGWGCYGPDGTTGNPKPCSYCYARSMAVDRKLRDCPECRRFVPHWHPEQLEKPKRWTKPRVIFVQSMGDLFHADTPRWRIDAVFDMVHQCPQHIFLFLTKNGENIKPDLYGKCNVWLGQTCTGETLKHGVWPLSLDKKPYPRSFISFEPLLGSGTPISLDEFGWIIIGSLNNRGIAVPPEMGGTQKKWVLNILEKSDRAGIPVFIKSELNRLYPDLPVKKDVPFKK